MSLGTATRETRLRNIALVLAAPVLSLVGMMAAQADTLLIHRYGAFSSQPVAARKSVTAATGEIPLGRTQINALGKRLILNLQSNTRLIDQLAATGNSVALLRGVLEGQPGSWVRLTQTSTGTHGLIWDGAELYAIEPASAVSDALAVSLPRPRTATVIFKLADTTLDLCIDSCGSQGSNDSQPTALATYRALAAELSEQIGAGSAPTLRLEMQALADAAFRAQYSSDQAALEAIMVRLNNIDGIFTAQVGLEIQATDIQIHDADPGDLASSTDANILVNSLGLLRKNNPVMTSYGATHLFTGRDLDGETLGIAYIGKICDTRYAVSLSEVRSRGAWIDSLVAAHELGHQLGAVHDGTGACSGTPAQSYLMGEQINGSSEMSQCSRDVVLATMQYAACLVPVGAPDVSLSAGSAPPHAEPDTSFLWSLPIDNVGTGAANQPTIHISLPTDLIVESSVIAGGSCIATNRDDGGTVDCIFDSLAANETRLLSLGLRARSEGHYEISAAVDTLGDNNPSNNTAIYALSVATTGAVAVGPVSATAESGSAASRHGGGALNMAGILMLGLLAAWRRSLDQRTA